jgi:hypothetical protein
MPPRSKVITVLPPNIRKEVERRMLAKRFSDYEGLAQWVREQGYDISDDSLWRYGKSLKQEFTAIRLSLLQARVLANAAPDYKGRMMQAVVQVVQQKLLSALAEADGLNAAHLCRLAHAVADLARVYFPQQQSAAEGRRVKKLRRRRKDDAIMAEDLREIFMEEQHNAGPAADELEPDEVERPVQ